MLKRKQTDFTAVRKLKPPGPESQRLWKRSFQSDVCVTMQPVMDPSYNRCQNVEADVTRCDWWSVATLLRAYGDAADVYTFSITALCQKLAEVTAGLICWCDWRLSRRKRNKRKLNKAASFQPSTAEPEGATVWRPAVPRWSPLNLATEWTGCQVRGGFTFPAASNLEAEISELLLTGHSI